MGKAKPFYTEDKTLKKFMQTRMKTKKKSPENVFPLADEH